MTTQGAGMTMQALKGKGLCKNRASVCEVRTEVIFLCRVFYGSLT